MNRRGFLLRVRNIIGTLIGMPFLRRAAAGVGLVSTVETGCRDGIPHGFLTPSERETLAAAVETVIPADSQPGAREAGVVDYIDNLLGAFFSNPPRIYGGGPYSGRHGGKASFQDFLPLTRVQEIRWRTYIEGSQGIPEREFNGPVAGLQTVFREGLAFIETEARKALDIPFTEASLTSRSGIILRAGKDFRDALGTLTMEGMYGDPVYGGNRGFMGWKNIQYEGDRQPIGYTIKQMSEPDAQ